MKTMKRSHCSAIDREENATNWFTALATANKLFKQLTATNSTPCSRQGIYCNNLANWVTEIFEVGMTSMMVGRQFKPWAHSRKLVVVT